MLRRFARIQALAKLVESIPESAPHQLAGRCQLHKSSLSAGQPPKDDTWFPPTAVFYPHQHQWHDKYCRQRNVTAVGPRFPAMATNVYVAPSAVVAGDVDILDGVRQLQSAESGVSACTRSAEKVQICECAGDYHAWSRHTRRLEQHQHRRIHQRARKLCHPCCKVLS